MAVRGSEVKKGKNITKRVKRKSVHKRMEIREEKKEEKNKIKWEL